jgi:hypothetical protein
MQMRGQKYIRFDSTQDLHTRVASAKRLLYRIIARARTFDHSLMRALASIAGPHHSAAAFAGCACARRSMRACANSCFPHIFWASPRIWIACGRAILRVDDTGLMRIRQRKWRGAQVRQSYQIETTRVLIAIEFFLAAVIIFLSLRRCKRQPRPLKRAANQAIRGARFDSLQTPSRFFSASLTACGLALPPVDLMT